MITKDMLMTASNFSKRCENYRGVLTTDEAQEYLKKYKQLIVISYADEELFFFTDDHCFGVNVLPDDWIPCTSNIPQRVMPRPGLEDGLIDTLDKHVQVFEKGYQITSVDQLVDILNK